MPYHTSQTNAKWLHFNLASTNPFAPWVRSCIKDVTRAGDNGKREATMTSYDVRRFFK